MQYILFTTVDKSGQPLPFDFLPSFGDMGMRSITRQQPQQKQAEQSSTGSWTGTLVKAALIGTALAGAAYAGYRFGFFDGAAGTFDTMKEHFQNPASQPSGFETGVGSDAMPGVELGTGAPNLAKTVGAAQSLTNPMDFEAMKQYFVGEAAKRNPLMNVELPKMPKFEMPFNTTKITDSVSEMYYTARNEAFLYLGAGTVAAVSTLWSVAKCLGAVHGLYR